MAFFRSLLISTNQTYLTFDAKFFKNHGAFLKHPWFYKYTRKRDVNSVENVHFNLRLCKHNLMQKTNLLQQSPTYITICCQCCLRSITHLASKTLVLKVRYRKYLAGKDEISRSHGLGKGVKQFTYHRWQKTHLAGTKNNPAKINIEVFPHWNHCWTESDNIDQEI